MINDEKFWSALSGTILKSLAIGGTIIIHPSFFILHHLNIFPHKRNIAFAVL